MTLVTAIAVWVLLSIPVGIAVGKWIKFCERNGR